LNIAFRPSASIPVTQLSFQYPFSINTYT
jgi:hypothetical protein